MEQIDGNCIMTTELFATTPIEITPEIIALCESLHITPPVYVPVVSDPHGVCGFCFPSVLDKIKDDGGSISFGWIVWERPKLLLSAEFHAVWVDQSGNFVDITPKHEDDIAEIVFAPDPSYPPNFDFWQRPNGALLSDISAHRPSEAGTGSVRRVQRETDQIRA